MLPSLFISHGSPMIMVQKNETTKFLENLPNSFPKPKYILVVSAHWVSKELTILYDENPGLMYDFYGFPNELYNLEYPIKSSIKKADEIVNHLEKNGLKINKEEFRSGFDHGVWSPLIFMYKDASIPVIQLSIPANYNLNDLFHLGETLKVFKEDTLIIGSGSVTHNLGNLNRTNENGTPDFPTMTFYNFVTSNLKEGNYINLFKELPYLKENHPSLEHFVPLYVTIGSAYDKKAEILNERFMYDNLSMTTFKFD